MDPRKIYEYSQYLDEDDRRALWNKIDAQKIDLELEEKLEAYKDIIQATNEDILSLNLNEQEVSEKLEETIGSIDRYVNTYNATEMVKIQKAFEEDAKNFEDGSHLKKDVQSLQQEMAKAYEEQQEEDFIRIKEEYDAMLKNILDRDKNKEKEKPPKEKETANNKSKSFAEEITEVRQKSRNAAAKAAKSYFVYIGLIKDKEKEAAFEKWAEEIQKVNVEHQQKLEALNHSLFTDETTSQKVSKDVQLDWQNKLYEKMAEHSSAVKKAFEKDPDHKAEIVEQRLNNRNKSWKEAYRKASEDLIEHYEYTPSKEIQELLNQEVLELGKKKDPEEIQKEEPQVQQSVTQEKQPLREPSKEEAKEKPVEQTKENASEVTLITLSSKEWAEKIQNKMAELSPEVKEAFKKDPEHKYKLVGDHLRMKDTKWKEAYEKASAEIGKTYVKEGYTPHNRQDTRQIVTKEQLNELIQNALAEKNSQLKEQFEKEPDNKFKAVGQFINASAENRTLYQETRKEIFKEYTLAPKTYSRPHNQSQNKPDTRQRITKEERQAKIQAEMAKRDPALNEKFTQQPEQKFEIVKQYIQNPEGRKLYETVRNEISKQYAVENTDPRTSISRSEYNQKVWDALSKRDESLKAQLEQAADDKQRFQNVHQFINQNQDNKAVFEEIKRDILKQYTVQKQKGRKVLDVNVEATVKAREFYYQKYQGKIPGMDVKSPVNKENYRQNGKAVLNFMNDKTASISERSQRAKDWRNCLEGAKKQLAAQKAKTKTNNNDITD